MMGSPWPDASRGAFWGPVWSAYGMDSGREFPGAPQHARRVTEHLVEAGFDLSISETSGRGFGHAIGFPMVRLSGDTSWGCIPILLNTYYPPNQPTPARCFDLGVALRGAIEALDDNARIALIASGGLSHFVVNEALDAQVLDALRTRDQSGLTSLPVGILNAGSSEIRNWITVAGAVSDVAPEWLEYVPCYRSLAGTGCGMAFAVWKPSIGEW
jgi:Catalytic LigB subunit of aromatic ring-opening dioxygenase